MLLALARFFARLASLILPLLALTTPPLHAQPSSIDLETTILEIQDAASFDDTTAVIRKGTIATVRFTVEHISGTSFANGDEFNTTAGVPPAQSNIFRKQSMTSDSEDVPCSLAGCTGRIRTGETVTFTVTFLAESVGTTTLTIFSTPNLRTDSNPGNNRHEIAIEVIEDEPGGDLALQIEAIQGAIAFDPDAKTARLPLGSEVTLCVRVTNDGPNEATSVVITGGADPAFFALQDVTLDPAIGTCSFSTEGGFFSCGGLTLAADASVKVNVTGVGMVETAETGFSTSTGHPDDPDFSNNDAAVTFTVEEVSLVTDLALLKRAREPFTGAEVDPGDTLTVALDGTFVYTISVANTSTTGGGPNDSPDTVVLDQIPDDVEYVSATTSRGTCRYDEDTRLVTCELGAVAAGEQLLDVIAITVRAKGDTGTAVRNTASVVGGLPDPDATNDESAVLAIPVDVDLAITKEASTQTPGFDVVYFYTLTVTNTGSSDAPNTVVRDTLNTRLGFVSATPTQGTCTFSETDRVLTCELGTVRSGETVPIRLAVRSDRVTSGVTNGATVTSDLPEADRTNNADDELVLVQPQGDGTGITKEVSSDRAVVGDTLVYTIRFDRTAGSDRRIVMTDTLSDKVRYAGLSMLDDGCQTFLRGTNVLMLSCRGSASGPIAYRISFKVVAVQPGVCPNVATVEEFAVTDTDTTLLTMDTDTAMVAVSESTPSEADPDVPMAFRLYENYPNPFNPATTLRFDVPARARVQLEVFDVLGREVATLVDQELAPGRHRAVFEAGTLPSGVYLYRLEAGAFTETRAMLLVK